MPRGVPKAGFRKTKKNNKSLKVLKLKDLIAENALKAASSRFSINERFGFVRDMVFMVASGSQASLIVSGDPGLGKSHSVISALQAAGYKDETLVDHALGSRPVNKKTYQLVKGAVSAKGLYRLLATSPDSVLVFDDADDIWRDETARNVLKGALDSYSRRVLSWAKEINEEDLPRVFEYTGKIIFISNIPSGMLDSAILSRALTVDLTMTTDQKIDRMRFLCSEKDFMPEYTVGLKMKAMEIIDRFRHEAKELSLRTLIKITRIAKEGGKNWESLAEYVLVG